MKRRKIIKLAAFATGAALSAPLLSSLLIGCKPEVTASSDSQYQLKFLNPDQMKMVQQLVDIILPSSDSPSASEVGVHRMIDHMVGTVYKKEHKSAYETKFLSLINFLDSTGEEAFTALKSEDQISKVQDLYASNEEKHKEAKEAFLELRQQTIAYYLSSEEIGMNYLNYLPVPGPYSGCISLEEAGGKAWAL